MSTATPSPKDGRKAYRWRCTNIAHRKVCDSKRGEQRRHRGDTENGENEEEDKEVGIIQETGDVALPAVRPVTESAIYDTNFIQLEGTDYKIAYLAYNSFTAGTAEQSEKYNNELRAFSQECKQRGINNLVLDFRYNSGGEMECVQLLADILVPADKLESPLLSCNIMISKAPKP